MKPIITDAFKVLSKVLTIKSFLENWSVYCVTTEPDQPDASQMYQIKKQEIPRKAITYEIYLYINLN